ncbi:calpain-9-like [Neosynchiropus ocellatus]
MHDHEGCTSIINLRYREGSEGSRTNPARFKYQDFQQLKDSCLQRRTQFVDRHFPPQNRSLGNLGMSRAQLNAVEWLRPSEILKANRVSGDPVFCSAGTSQYDFAQGNVYNCWFLAAVGTLTAHKSLMAQVVPPEQTFSNNPGIFHFRFWRFGKWVDVVVDDHLPTINKRLISVQPKDVREFWAPLLEKAYAKVCGSYADTNAGNPTEACKDFSGGVHKTFELGKGQEDQVWTALERAFSCRALVCCAIDRTGNGMTNSVLSTGLVEGHAYSLTGITEVDYYGSKVKLVRTLNPWGEQEWNRKWSDKSSVWDRVSQQDRAKLMEREDGEFWIEMSDFDKNFSIVTVTCENPNFLDGDVKAQWQCMIYDGSWEAGRSAGGSPSNSSYSDNPQYRLTVKDTRDAGDDMNIAISLMQVPQQQRRSDARFHPIGTAVYKAPGGHLGRDFFYNNRPLKDVQMYAYSRDIIAEYSLPAGEYVVIPSTMKPYMSGDFVLTIFSKTDAQVTPHEGDHDHDHDHEEEEETRPVEPPTVTPGPEEEVSLARAIFNRYRDQDDLLSALQLMKLLNDQLSAGTRSGFSYDNAKSLIAMYDTKRIRMMAFSDFEPFWKKVTEYKDLFKSLDKNYNGFLSDNEILMALGSVGWEVQQNLLRLLVSRYSGSSTTLESFIMIMLRMNKGSNVFTERSEDGSITMTWTDFSELMAM